MAMHVRRRFVSPFLPSHERGFDVPTSEQLTKMVVALYHNSKNAGGPIIMSFMHCHLQKGVLIYTKDNCSISLFHFLDMELMPDSQCPSEAILASFHEDTSLEPPACHDDRNTSETFDNPIYDHPSPHRKDGNSLTESRLCGSMPSSQSISVNSSQNYSPLCPRAFDHSHVPERSYESEESLNTLWKRMNCSPHLANRGNLVDSEKLTVINESYASLPCSAAHSNEFLQDSSSLQASGGTASLATADSRLLGGRPTTITKVVSPIIWNKGRLGGQPDSREHLKHHSRHHAHGFDVEIEIEASEQ